MTFERPLFTKRRFQLLYFLLTRSWGAWLSLLAFGVFRLAGSYEFAGLFILGAAVSAMLGFGQTELILAHRTPQWWRENRALHLIHHINSEGEMAGVLVGLLAFLILLITEGLTHFHWPLEAFFTLFGIMSGASLIVPYMMPILETVEKYLGKYLAIFIGSVFSSLIGEPAAAVFITRYVAPRVKYEHRSKVAVGLAGTIGSGGGLMYHAALPILIVWPILQEVFGWTLVDLWMYVGAGCMVHVLLCTFYVVRYLENSTLDSPIRFSLIGNLMLVGLIVLIAMHIFIPGTIVWIIDALLGITNIIVMRRRYTPQINSIVTQRGFPPHSARAEADDEIEILREEKFAFQWQPLLLASLLVALDIIGVAGEPFVAMLAGLIPITWPVWLIAILVFFLSAITSHFADNALASRVYMAIPVAFISTLGMMASTVVAIAVITGALFGGILLIPSNLPNFAIARVLRVLSSEWASESWKLYWTVVAYLVPIIFWSFWLL